MGVEPWDDLFLTLRRSAETMFGEKHPQYAISQWIGHSMKVSERHYGMIPDFVLDAASGETAACSRKCSRAGN